MQTLRFTHIAPGVLRMRLSEAHGTTLAERYSVLTLPETLEFLGEGQFQDGVSLRNIAIPPGVMRIESASFAGCTALSQVQLPDALTFIGEMAFSGCRELGELRIPESVTEIADDAFEECAKLTFLAVPNSAGHRYAEKNGIPFRLRTAAD